MSWDEPKPPCSACTTSTSGSAKSAFRSAARRLRVAGDVVVTIPDAVRELDAVAACLPPLDAAQNVGAAVVRACRRDDADRAAVREGSPEPRGGGHLQIRTVCVASASRPRTSETTAVSVCAPLRLPPVRQFSS